MSQPIRFDNGEAYERGMGRWSRLAGEIFLDWLAPAPGLAWIDIGCGNGAFTDLLLRRTEPAEVQAIDPSAAQLAYARAHIAGAAFIEGDAMALPFTTARFDAATMALVIFFVPEPAMGVAEMVRVTRPGGLVAAYAWDMFGGGFPFHPIQEELRALGHTPPFPPRAEASRLENLRALWEGAGLIEVETRSITVERHFADAEDHFAASTITGSIAPALATLPAEGLAAFKARLAARLTVTPNGVSTTARAHAVRGRVPR